MAKFGVDVTNISPANVQPFIAPGVQTQTPTINAGVANAKMIGELGGMAVDAYKGYQLADLEKAQEANIEAYQSSYRTEQDKADAVDQAKFELGASEQTLNVGWGVGDNQPTADINTISDMERNNQTSLTKLKNAYDQGVISPAEFHAKVLKTTREAVAKNPGLYPELIGHAQKVMDLSGITEIVKNDQRRMEDQQKSAQKHIENVYSEADKFQIQRTANTPFSTVEAEVNRFRGRQQKVDEAERAKKFHDSISAVDALAWAEQHGSDVSQGIRDRFQLSVAQAAASVDSPKDAAGFLNLIRGMGQGIKDEFRSVIPGRVRGETVIKDEITHFNKAVDDAIERAKTYTTKEDMAKSMENSLKIIQTGQELKVRERVNPFALDLATKALQAAPGLLQSASKKDREAMFSMMIGLTSGDFTSPVLTNAMPKNEADKKLTMPLAMAIEGKSWEAFGKIMDTYKQIPGDSEQKQLQSYNTLEAVSKGDFTGAGQDVFIKTKGVIDGYLTSPGHGLPKMFPFIKENPVVLDVLPNGMLAATGPGSEAFNARFGIKINTALTAYAKAANMSPKEVAGNFYTEYFKPYADAESLLKDPDIGKPGPKEKRISQQEVAGRIKTPDIVTQITPEEQARRDKLATQIRQGEGVSPVDVAELEKEIKKKNINSTAKSILIREWELSTGKKWN